MVPLYLFALNSVGPRLEQVLGMPVVSGAHWGLVRRGGYYAAAGLAAVMFVVGLAAIR